MDQKAGQEDKPKTLSYFLKFTIVLTVIIGLLFIVVAVVVGLQFWRPRTQPVEVVEIKETVASKLQDNGTLAGSETASHVDTVAGNVKTPSYDEPEEHTVVPENGTVVSPSGEASTEPKVVEGDEDTYGKLQLISGTPEKEASGSVSSESPDVDKETPPEKISELDKSTAPSSTDTSVKNATTEDALTDAGEINKDIASVPNTDSTEQGMKVSDGSVPLEFGFLNLGGTFDTSPFQPVGSFGEDAQETPGDVDGGVTIQMEVSDIPNLKPWRPNAHDLLFPKVFDDVMKQMDDSMREMERIMSANMENMDRMFPFALPPLDAPRFGGFW